MYAAVTKHNWTPALTGSASSTSDGYFITPSIIDNPPEDSRIVQEEPFGPIVPLLKWSDEQDVIDRANATRMGLGASVWSRDLGRAERMARELEAGEFARDKGESEDGLMNGAIGSVWVNSHFDVDPKVPFGGHKECVY
jgi:acyl-CoA reductase-like NAD-dependent aldehyde dehydrogenase